MIIILAVLSLVVVKALADSPWGLFTIAATIPIALIMGVYMRFIRPGRVGEASVIGVVLLLAALIYGQSVANDPVWGPFFTWHGTQAGLGDHRLRRHRIQPAGVADAGAARLPEHVPQDRHDRGAGDRHLLRRAATWRCRRRRASSTAAGRCSPGTLFPFLFITIACGCGVGLPCADLLGHDAQDDREGIAHAADRLRRHAHRILRRDHGADRGLRARPGHLLRDERAGRGHRHDGGERGAGHLRAGASRSRRTCSRRPRRTSARTRSSRAPAARRRWRSAWRRSWPRRSAARRWRRSGTTSPSCSRRCSS